MSDRAVPIVDDLLRPPSREELVESARRVFVDESVRQFVLMVQLAAELYPEELRTALGYVFDVTAAEQRLQQIAVLANRVDQQAAEARMLAEDVTKDVETNLERVSEWADALARRYAKAHAFLTKLAALHKAAQPPARK